MDSGNAMSVAIQVTKLPMSGTTLKSIILSVRVITAKSATSFADLKILSIFTSQDTNTRSSEIDALCFCLDTAKLYSI